MKNWITILLFLIPIYICGQGKHLNEIDSVLNQKPTTEVYLIIDEVSILLDSISIQRINPKWIKNIEFVKKEKYKYIYGNGGGYALIYPKKKFKKKLSEYFNAD